VSLVAHVLFNNYTLTLPIGQQKCIQHVESPTPAISKGKWKQCQTYVSSNLKVLYKSVVIIVIIIKPKTTERDW